VETDAAGESMQSTEAIKPRSFFSRLAGTYTAPGETFKELGRSPGVLMPIIVLVVISVLAAYYLTQKIDLSSLGAAQLESMVEQGRITKEQMEQQMALVSKFAGAQVIVVGAIGNLLIALVIAGVFKLISSFISTENRFKALFAVTMYAMIAVSIVQSVAMVLVLSIKNPGEITATGMSSILASNLGALLSGILGEDALPKFLVRLLSFVDIFAIWIIALLSIGYAAVSRKLKTSTVATWLVVLYAIIAVISAGLGSLIS
jgi:hypothetical protein